MAIDVESFCGPEHDHREEIGPGDEGDEQRKAKSTRLLFDARGEDRVLGAIRFPETEGDQQNNAKDQRDEYMGTRPWILSRPVSEL